MKLLMTYNLGNVLIVFPVTNTVHARKNLKLRTDPLKNEKDDQSPEYCPQPARIEQSINRVTHTAHTCCMEEMLPERESLLGL